MKNASMAMLTISELRKKYQKGYISKEQLEEMVKGAWITPKAFKQIIR